MGSSWIIQGPTSMTGVFLRDRRGDADTGEKPCDVGGRGMWPQAKDNWETREGRGRADPPLEPMEGV